MSWVRVASMLLWAAALGLAASFLRGEDRVVSIEIWFAGFAAWLALSILLSLMRAVPLTERGWVGVIPLPRRRKYRTVRSRPRDLEAIESLVLRARDNERVHTQQLQPRLTRVAEHHLSVRHGLSLQTDRDRVAALFGDVAWLIDQNAPAKSPTLEQLGRFIEILIPADPPAAEPAPTEALV